MKKLIYDENFCYEILIQMPVTNNFIILPPGETAPYCKQLKFKFNALRYMMIN